MAQRLTYVGPFDSIELQVGAGRFELVRSANPAFDEFEWPESLRDVPSTITVSDELAELLLAPDGVEPAWVKAGGRASRDDVVDDVSLPALRWRRPVGDDLVEPVTGFVSPAELEKAAADQLQAVKAAAEESGDTSELDRLEALQAEREAAVAADVAAGQAAAREHAAAVGDPEPEFVMAAVAPAPVVEPPAVENVGEGA